MLTCWDWREEIETRCVHSLGHGAAHGRVGEALLALVAHRVPDPGVTSRELGKQRRKHHAADTRGTPKFSRGIKLLGNPDAANTGCMRSA